MVTGFQDLSGTNPNLGQEDFARKQKQIEKERIKTKRAECIQRGGVWDDATQSCSLPDLKPDQSQVGIEAPEGATVVQPTAEPIKVDDPSFDPSKQDGDLRGPRGSLVDREITINDDGSATITGADGRTITLNKEEYKAYRTGKGLQSENVLAARSLINQSQLQGQQLAGQAGQFNQLGIDATGLRVGEALTTGLVDSIPRAISFAASGALLGGATGAAAGSVVTPGIGTIIGAGAGALAGIASGMISSFKGQRRDTTTAQQRVLDEGKQTMKDWATMAAADPANKARYLAEFNKVAQQIDLAYRQMKLDTQRDVAKFETALPNLAEFEAFYAGGGERDVLVQEMQQALQGQVDPVYSFGELTNRRGK